MLFYEVVLGGVRVTAVVVTAVVKMVTGTRTSLCIRGDYGFRGGLVLPQLLEPLLSRPGLWRLPDRSGRTFTDQDQGCGQDGAAGAENGITVRVVAEAIKASPAAPTEARGIRQTDGIIGGVSATQRLL